MLLLSETKCKKRWTCLKIACKTELSGKGGALAIFDSNRAKMIKYLVENLLWTSNLHDGALMHYITVYVSPKISSSLTGQ